MKISSEHIKKLKSLATVAGRHEQQACIVEGIRAVLTWLQAGARVHELYLTTRALAQYGHDLQPWASGIHEIDEATCARISQHKSPSGVLGVFALPMLAPLPEQRALVLAGLQDPGNVGTLIRTALALGVEQVVLVDTVDPWSSKVIQSSAGTVISARMSVCSWDELVAWVGSDRLAALTPRGGVIPRDLSPAVTDRLCVVVGNEGSGLPTAWQRACGHQVTIPMPGGDHVESLNAAIAGALALYTLFIQPNTR